MKGREASRDCAARRPAPRPIFPYRREEAVRRAYDNTNERIDSDARSNEALKNLISSFGSATASG